MENKKLFVEALKVAFMAGDNNRYHDSIWFVEYRTEDGQEWLLDGRCGVRHVNVTGCSCAAIAEAIIENFL